MKLIAEAWDCDGLNQVGAFPHYGGRWSEWNGTFRDTVRMDWLLGAILMSRRRRAAHTHIRTHFATLNPAPQVCHEGHRALACHRACHIHT